MAVNIGALELSIAATGTRGVLRDLDAVDRKARGTAGGFDDVDRSARKAGSGVGMAATSFRGFLAAGGISLGVAAIASSFRSAVAAATDLNKSALALAGAAKMTGTPLATLTATAARAREQFGLSAVAANQLTAMATRLAVRTGDVGQASSFMAGWLELAAANGYTTAEAMGFLETTLAGNDEGLNRLGLMNPGQIWAKWADQIGVTVGKMTEQQKWQAILNEVTSQGALVTGALSARMDTAAGKTEALNNATTALLETLGTKVTSSATYTQFIDDITSAIKALTAMIRGDGPTIAAFLQGIVNFGMNPLGTLMSAATRNAGQFAGVVSGGSTTAGAPAGTTGGGTGRTGGGRGRGGAIGGTRPDFAPVKSSDFTLANINAGPLATRANVLPLAVAPILPPPEEVNRLGGQLGQTMGAALSAGFDAAFTGGNFFEGFGNVMLAGLGDVMTQMGLQLINFGGIMQALFPFLANPLSAGPAAIAAGVALVGLGAALGAIAGGGGKRGGGGGLRGGGRVAPAESGTVRLGPTANTMANGGKAASASAPFVFAPTIIGENDPRAQRQLAAMVEKAARRGY
jgi:hypothetical protein